MMHTDQGFIQCCGKVLGGIRSHTETAANSWMQLNEVRNEPILS